MDNCQALQTSNPGIILVYCVLDTQGSRYSLSNSVSSLLMLEAEIVALTREIYGSLAPNTSFQGHLVEDGKGPLFIYVIDRL